MKKSIFIYLMIGILLIVGLVYFDSSDISDINKDLYEKAMNLENTMEDQVWNGFKLSKYPLAIRKDDNEYVFYKGEIRKRQATLEVYAFTALKVNEEINIFMLQFEDMDSIMNPMGISTALSNKNQYIATMFHEGFHAYQWENSHILESNDFEFDNINIILDRIDNDDSLRIIYENEMKVLYNGINEKDKSKKEKLIRAYIDERKKRNRVLKEKLDPHEFEILESFENKYELIEGTAHYIELKAIELLNDEDVYKNLIDSLKYYHRNNTKYYKTGMGICLLLDELVLNWKADVFDNNIYLFEKLSDAIGG